MTASDETRPADPVAIKKAAKREFGGIDGVEGIGLGDGTLRIYVRHAGLHQLLPKRFRGLDVDLVVTGDITSL
jgi:hypothetical protein